MKTKRIIFTKPNTAQLIDFDVPELVAQAVLVENEYSVISAGTERANLIGMQNVNGVSEIPLGFPRYPGYCAAGRVKQTGDKVTYVKPGDRVLVYNGYHGKYVLVPEANLVKVGHDSLDLLDASLTIIAHMSLGGVRKARVEFGESAMTLGLGLLGLFSVQMLRLCGAYPVIAADPTKARRELATKLGADVALDPTEHGFAENIKSITQGGAGSIIEVSGVASALETALKCVKRQGKIVLLGCTRVSDCTIDYYKQVHCTGVSLIGAHTSIRPVHESYPCHWTFRDDCAAILNLLGAKRLNFRDMVSEVVSPEQAESVYSRLAGDRNFPLGVVFDWKRI